MSKRKKEEEEVINESCSDSFKRDLDMLKYFQEEFLYRHKHYWDILIKLFILTVTISILPITGDVFGIKLAEIDINTLISFPRLGLLVSIFSLFILLSEAKRIKNVNDSKYELNEKMVRKYQYVFLRNRKEKKEKILLSYITPLITWLIELVIISYSTIVILLMQETPLPSGFECVIFILKRFIWIF